MSLFLISLKNILSKPLNAALSVLLFGFGVGIIVLILLTGTHLKNEINKNASGIDLVVAAKGSPLQIILCNIFHIDFPTGNISLQEAAKLSKSRLVKSTIPLSLGDSYSGYRIVGTTEAYIQLYEGEFAEGGWPGSDMKAVVGAAARDFLSLKIGDTFSSTHGMAETGAGHDEHPYEVAGVLKPSGTVLDKLILVSIPSVWKVHGHEEGHEAHADSLHEKVAIPTMGITVTKEQLQNEEITSVLVEYASPMAAIRLPQAINKKTNFQAASPAFETARLFNLIGTGVEIINILGVVVIVISALSVFISLVNSLKERKYELAILRSMGAHRWQIFFLVLLEGMVLTLFGLLFGFLLAHSGFELLSSFAETLQTEGMFFVKDEWKVLAGSLAIGMVSSVIPAIMAYRSDISKTLARG